MVDHPPLKFLIGHLSVFVVNAYEFLRVSYFLGFLKILGERNSAPTGANDIENKEGADRPLGGAACSLLALLQITGDGVYCAHAILLIHNTQTNGMRKRGLRSKKAPLGE